MADAERVVRGDRERDGSIARAELLHDERDRQDLELGATVFVRNGEARQPERGELRKKLERKLAPFTPPARVWDDPRPHEVADGIADEKLIVPVREVQTVLSATRLGRTSPRRSSAGARQPSAGPPRARHGRR